MDRPQDRRFIPLGSYREMKTEVVYNKGGEYYRRTKEHKYRNFIG